MIDRPVLIVGAPRSGTSLLQKVLRNHPAFWSMPSESDIIWDRFCHPALRGWESEAVDETDLTEADRKRIISLFEDYIRPAAYWRPFEKTNLIWSFRRVPALRRAMRNIFARVAPLIGRGSSRNLSKRLLEKTASNCFRLGYVNAVFPDAKIIYPVRDGRNTVNSMINAWRHPKRFFSYDVPAELDIAGYDYDRWNFVLPPGWRDYTTRSLAEVCAFQWRSCNEFMLAETARERYEGRVMRIRLEDLVADPEAILRRVAEFLELPYDDYFDRIARELPVVNSPDGNVSQDKWRGENRQLVEAVVPMIVPTMRRLGYEID